ncbi:unnamed protein product [Symbiodinium sp. CCMP2456]|nr:unnamed protein product [Symbiodinium sp. CCMP2456]
MDSSDGGAMESANGSCPVLSAWANSTVVMSQLLKDKLCILQYPTLSRMRPTVPGIAELLRRFYSNNLPVTRKAPAGLDYPKSDYNIRKGGTSSVAGDGESSDREDVEASSGEENHEGGESEAASDDLEVEMDAGTITKLVLPGVSARSPPSESSSSLVVTPPPRGLPYSPQSEAKKHGKHYFVKDRAYGYRCLNCDCASMDLGDLKALECQPPKGSEARVEAADAAELELAKLRDLEAEGLQLQELLLFEQQQLEEMMIQCEIEELQKQLAIEEQQLHEAKVRSLEDAAHEATAAAGPDCLDTLPWNLESAGLEDASFGEPHHLNSEDTPTEPDDDIASDKEPESPKFAKQEDMLPGCPDPSKAEPLSPAEQKAVGADDDKVAVDVAALPEPRGAAGDGDGDGDGGCLDLQFAIVSKDGKSEPPEQVLLLRWMTTLSFDETYEFFELFSGEGKVTQFWHGEGYATASFDKLYGDPMNFLQNQGFSIACWVVLNECPDAFNLIGPDCSSWGLPARSTSMRSSINPFGRMGIAWVSSNYCLVSRLVLLLLLVMAKQSTWVVEQPHQSLLKSHARWDWMCNQVVRVFQQHFWMMLHGAASPKPTIVFSPMATISQLDRGRLTKVEKQKRSKLTTVRTIA